MEWGERYRKEMADHRPLVCQGSMAWRTPAVMRLLRHSAGRPLNEQTVNDRTTDRFQLLSIHPRPIARCSPESTDCSWLVCVIIITLTILMNINRLSVWLTMTSRTHARTHDALKTVDGTLTTWIDWPVSSNIIMYIINLTSHCKRPTSCRRVYFIKYQHNRYICYTVTV